ncbi:MAG: inositol monophosphatase family protein [Anaerolineae bacterium]|nr:inositol monophosphatase family protein [Anaerolineae bacterium]
MELQNYLDFATELAYRAGRITLGYFNTGVQPEFKSDDTPVTVADKAAEQYIRAEIERAYPSHAIVGEEFGETVGEQEPIRWYIDPIDGTKSFMHAVPLYSVLIALEIEGTIRVGAAYFPGTDEMLNAADGLGCWWNGRRAKVSKEDSLDRACICYGSWKSFENRTPGSFARISDAVYMTRGWSDAYGYLLVATGRAEAAFDPIMNVWDCAPFPVIFREAGGYFGNWRGEEGHEHGESLATNAALKSKILDLVRDA